MSTTKKYICLLLLTPLMKMTLAQDSAAVRIVENSLDTIKQYQLRPYPKSISTVTIAARFMIDLTGIPSTSDGNYVGQYPPNEADLRNWYVWFELNKQYLVWDKKSQSIILKKQVPIPEY